MASGVTGAMDSLKGRVSRSGKIKKTPSSRVKQFYDEFNSSQSSLDASSDESEKGTFFGYKNRPKAPMIRPVSAARPASADVPQDLNSTPSESGSLKSPKFYYTDPPVSPGLTPNQDIKDNALNVIYQKRIRELKSIPKNY